MAADGPDGRRPVIIRRGRGTTQGWRRALSVRTDHQSPRAPPGQVSGAMSPAVWQERRGCVIHRPVRLRSPRRGRAACRPDRDERSTRSWPTIDAPTRTRGERLDSTSGRRSGMRLHRRKGPLSSVFGGCDRRGSTHAAEGYATEDVLDSPGADLGVDDGEWGLAAERTVRALEPSCGRFAITEC